MATRHHLPLNRDQAHLRKDLRGKREIHAAPRQPVGIVLAVVERGPRYARRADCCRAATEITLKSRRP